MDRKTAARLGWGLAGLFVLLAVGGIWMVALSRPAGALVENGAYALVFLAIELVGALIVSRQPHNAFGWVFLGTAMAAAVAFSAEQFAHYSLTVRPSPLPGTVLAAWISTWAWLPVWTFPASFVMLLFPDGHLPSRRWRPFSWAVVLLLVTMGISFMFEPGPLEGTTIPNPVGIEALNPVVAVFDQLGVVILAIALVSAWSLVIRFRRSKGEQRQQIKWFALAAVFLAVDFVLSMILELLPGDWSVPVTVLGVLALLSLPVAAGIAILKYRLYEIDVVINKAVLFGMLAAAITVVYVGIVVGIGAFVGSRGELLLSIVATALIAVAFQPLRARARHLANRLVYGRRAQPYELLGEFSERLAGSYSADDVLPRMARLVAEGTGATSAGVWLRLGDTFRPVATWPESAEVPRPQEASGTGIPAFPRESGAFPVRHQGEILGALTVSSREALRPEEERLVAGVAAQAGLILRNVRLIEELRASRQRLVAAQDEERRRLERNIHDGAQQQLVALSVKLRLAEGLARKDPDKAAELVSQVRTETQHALEDLRDLARGIYPPLLADRGLTAALESQARKAPLPVTVEAGGVGRYSQEAEAATYFCVLEALQNVSKYAEASAAVVRLAHEDGHLVFSVTDDGRGFDPATTPRGSGLQNMADRLEALGGGIEVLAREGEGTTVVGTIPVQTEAAAQASSSRSGSSSDLGM